MRVPRFEGGGATRAVRTRLNQFQLTTLLPSNVPRPACDRRARIVEVSEHRRDNASEDPRAPAERFVRDALIDDSGVGKPLKRSSVQRQRSVESYLRGEVLPRFVQRASEIERGTRRLLEDAAVAQRRLRETTAPEAFADAWRERVADWDLEPINELVRQHNMYYPIERDLPMDPRTGDYVLIGGRSYRREELTPAWLLERLPAE
jgi:hypothetical protein